MAVSDNKSTSLVIILLILVVGLVAVFSWQGVTRNGSRVIQVTQKEHEVALSKKADESKLVNAGKYQAVFLSNGQVYFGKIAEMNQVDLTLTNIYYLHSN